MPQSLARAEHPQEQPIQPSSYRGRASPGRAMVTSDLDRLLAEQMEAVQRKFSRLQLQRTGDGTPVVTGSLAFRAVYEEYAIETEYLVEISVPWDYPAIPPLAKETGGRIPADFHRMPDGTLCLGASLAVRMKFARQRSLLGFTEELLVPFLFAHAYYEKHGEMPFGELKHGGEGLLDFYKDMFDVEGDLAVLGLLKILADDNYRGHTPCPCGSGLRLRDCHGHHLLTIKQYQSKVEFLYDHTAVCRTVCKQDPEIDPRPLLAKVVRKRTRTRK